MSKVDDFLDVLCSEYEFTHGSHEHKRAKIEQLLKLANLIIVRAPPDGPGLHSEHDQYVVSRARLNADRPYDQGTCERYPWAAAARITYLEGVIEALRPEAMRDKG